MKKSFAFLFVCFFICTASIKTNEFKRSENSSINAPSYFQEQELENINWVSLNLEIKNSPVEFFSKWKSLFKLSNEDNFKLIQQKTDDLGHNHYYYNQSFKGIPIELSSVILHEENGIVTLMNGRIHRNLDIDVNPKISETQAFEIAIKYINADIYAWENDSLEYEIKVRTKNNISTWLPKGNLTILASESAKGTTYNLCYRFEIFSLKPYSRKLVIIDASNGTVISSHSLSFNATGTVTTLFNGDRSFTTKYRGFPSFNFILLDDTRGYISTKDDANYITSWFGWGSTSHISDPNNSWNDTDLKHVGASAQWAAEMVYDYYKTKYNRYGIGGNNDVDLRITVFAPDGPANTGWHPDYIDSDWIRLGIDSSKDSIYYQNVSLDIIGHEYTHGVIVDESNILYSSGENGALIESFCDIFGTLVEKYVEGSQGDWTFAEDAYESYFLRDLSNPLIRNQPNTKGGTYWLDTSPCPVPGSPYYCNERVVYTNMGVQNYWFYLLSSGGTHNNITVSPIGIDKAAKIAYYNMVYYFDANSNYDDARNGSIQAAKSLYGECSNEYKQVMNAWAAVGVGSPSPNPCIIPLAASIISPYEILCNNCNIWTASVSGGTGTYTYQWYVNGNLESIDSFLEICLGDWENQYFDIQLIVTSGSETVNAYNSFYIDCTGQYLLQNASFDANIYPNPVTDLLNIDIIQIANEPISTSHYYFYILDINGNKIINGSAGYGLKSIDLKKLLSNTYYIVISDGKTSISKQFIKK